MLNFWASWCRPCLEEMPALAKLSERFHRRGVKVVAASIDDPDSHQAVRLLAEHLPKPMEIWVGATVADMLRLQVGDSLPVTVLIDRDGQVTHVHHGVVAENSFDETLRRLLEDDPDRKHPTRPDVCRAESRPSLEIALPTIRTIEFALLTTRGRAEGTRCEADRRERERRRSGATS